VTDLRERLSHVLWIGGGTGAGKSSVAIALAERYGLARYDYDWHDARDHTERTRPDRHPHRAAFLAMSLDERWVLRSPREMADNAVGSFRDRFEMVIEDLLALPRDRAWRTMDDTSDADRARRNRLARDELLTDHVRQSAARLGFATIKVDGSLSLGELTAEVDRVFSPLLSIGA